MGNEQGNEYTEGLGEYPYLEDLKKSEGSKSKRYRIKGEAYDTIGYGHLIENEETYKTLTKQLEIKDPENLSKEDKVKLLNYDVDLRRYSMKKEYPEVKQNLLDEMLTVRYQFSPDGFSKYFGAALKTGNIDALTQELGRLGTVFAGRGQKGVKIRWDKVITNLKKLGEKNGNE